VEAAFAGKVLRALRAAPLHREDQRFQLVLAAVQGLSSTPSTNGAIVDNAMEIAEMAMARLFPPML
jgi:hypothetical protein